MPGQLEFPYAGLDGGDDPIGDFLMNVERVFMALSPLRGGRPVRAREPGRRRAHPKGRVSGGLAPCARSRRFG